MMIKPLLSGVTFNSLEVMLYAMVETNNQMKGKHTLQNLLH
jgi:hypothetical protein